MIIASASILVITFSLWLLNKWWSVKICPVCAGVLLTWLWLLAWLWRGQLLAVDYQLPIAILAGGTVVGLMSKLEPVVKAKYVLLWKTLFVTSGFVAVYSLVVAGWVMFSVGVVLAGIGTLVFNRSTAETGNQESEQTKALQEKMKRCC